jgi:hypothetical protein
MYLEFAMLQGCYVHGQSVSHRGLDPYLGQGATENIWFYPQSEDPEKLRNALAEQPAPQEGV